MKATINETGSRKSVKPAKRKTFAAQLYDVRCALCGLEDLTKKDESYADLHQLITQLITPDPWEATFESCGGSDRRLTEEELETFEEFGLHLAAISSMTRDASEAGGQYFGVDELMRLVSNHFDEVFEALKLANDGFADPPLAMIQTLAGSSKVGSDPKAKSEERNEKEEVDDYDVLTAVGHVVGLSDSSPHKSPKGPEKAALFGINRLSRTVQKPNGGGPYEYRV